MSSIGLSEILLILVIGLLVLPPAELSKLASRCGHGLRVLADKKAKIAAFLSDGLK